MDLRTNGIVASPARRRGAPQQRVENGAGGADHGPRARRNIAGRGVRAVRRQPRAKRHIRPELQSDHLRTRDQYRSRHPVFLWRLRRLHHDLERYQPRQHLRRPRYTLRDKRRNLADFTRQFHNQHRHDCGHGDNDTGVALFAGGTVNNQSGGQISGGSGGNGVSVGFVGGAAAVTNAGTITGGGASIALFDGGTVNNQSGGQISGGDYGVYAFGGTVAVTNAGTIDGNSLGVELENGGTVNNQSGATISSSGDAIFIYGGTGSVTNAGAIVGEVGFDDASSISNQSGGTISGSVFFSGTGTVTNAGTISTATRSTSGAPARTR